MVVVVVINLVLALILLFVAWQIWQLRLKLAQVADILLVYDRVTHAALYQTPDAIAAGQLAMRQVQQPNLPARLKLVRIQQVLNLLNVGLEIGQQTLLVGQSRFLRQVLTRSRSK